MRREWATEHGLEAFNTPRYDRALDAIWQRIGVTTGNDPHRKLCCTLQPWTLHIVVDPGIHCIGVTTGSSCHRKLCWSPYF